ncbi:MAG: GNAT family N-acetyltransferase [Parvularculaceae bacterium]|nr:GNAT family N-acetyltransferase [Parvularculaceae bacterium]
MNRKDLDGVASVLDGTALFPSQMLPEMAEPYLIGGSPHVWLTAHEGMRVVGFAYCEPERMTEGAYNLLAIAVDPDRQGRRVGQGLVSIIEQHLRDRAGRILLVETSSLPEYERTRTFYDKLGFTREATIRDFYKKGESKVVFWKEL